MYLIASNKKMAKLMCQEFPGIKVYVQQKLPLSSISKKVDPKLISKTEIV